MRANRLLAIVTILLDQGSVTATALARRFEVSVRTIYRDIDMLGMAGIPVVTARGSGGGIRLMEGYTLDRNLFTRQEQRDLLTALQTLKAAQHPGVESALEKLGALVHHIPRIDWVKVDFAPWGCDSEEEQKFYCLRQGILDHRLARFEYTSSVGQRTQRIVEPVQLWFKGSCWYLSAWCRQRGALRTFRITRMHQVRLLEQDFAPRKLPPIQIDPPMQRPEGLVHLHLRFDPSMEYRLLDEYPDWMIHRCEDGFLEVEPVYPEDGWVYGHLLSFGPGVQVISPPHVRQHLAKAAQAMLKYYENTADGN